MSKKFSAILAMMVVAPAALAQSVPSELMTCPLTSLVFEDSADGRNFLPNAVGRLSIVPCADGAAPISADDPNAAECGRAITYYFLEGLFDDPAPATSKSNTWATWSIIPAAPCCSWSFALAENGFGRIASGVSDQGALYELIEWDFATTEWTLERLGAIPALDRSRGAIRQDSVLRPTRCLG